jgi:hypothetical protein
VATLRTIFLPNEEAQLLVSKLAMLQAQLAEQVSHTATRQARNVDNVPTVGSRFMPQEAPLTSLRILAWVQTARVKATRCRDRKRPCWPATALPPHQALHFDPAA